MTNKEVAAAFFEEFFNNHDFSAIDKYISPDYIQHDWDVPPGREGFREHFKHVFEMFPNFRVNVRSIICEGDMLALRGYGLTEPGKIEVLVVDTYRLENGLLVEHWGTVQPLPTEQFGNPQLL